MKTFKNWALKKIMRDARILQERDPEALAKAQYKDAIQFKVKVVRCYGAVPESMRATYLLIAQYEKKQKKAVTLEEKVEFAALAAAAQLRWKIELSDLRRGILRKIRKMRHSCPLEVLSDWSLAIITLE